eukprot:GABV01007142.1.p1 GENE.GABV01007142.1~~GABV01007142.1.p1  ORF type:complete len:108 (-),score=14.16 GABV01007142.1:52-375(-)
MIRRADQPDILRASQKDEYYLSILRDECQELASHLFGARSALYSDEIDLLSALGYFAMTTVAGHRTLGEEYCDILQVAGPTRRLHLPRPLRRSALYFSLGCRPVSIS